MISQKIMAMMHESARVQELEFELGEIRAAFEEYITSSRELENGLDGELGDMRTLQLDRSMTSKMTSLTLPICFVIIRFQARTINDRE